MKKIILTLLLCLTCLFSLTGCDNLGTEYWLDTNSALTEIFVSGEGETINNTYENFNETYNIVFSDKLNTVMGVSDSYAEIETVFKPLFNSAISYARNHYNDFLITPKNNNDKFKKEIKNVNKKLNAFKENLEEFVNKKVEYESYVTFETKEVAETDVQLGRLLLFKRDYISVIESAFNLSESVFNARRIGYYDFSEYKNEEIELVEINADCSLAVNATNLEITNCAISIARAYNAKQLASKYENYWNGANDYYTNVVEKYENGELTASETAKEKLAVWQDVYEMFKNEKENFLDILKELDLELLLQKNNNPSLYAEATGEYKDMIKATFFINFYKNIETLKTYTLNIFN